jgi:hypothetical protein
MDFITAYRAAIDESIARGSEAIAGGLAKSYDEYRYLVGISRGLQKSLQVLEDVLKAMQEKSPS